MYLRPTMTKQPTTLGAFSVSLAVKHLGITARGYRPAGGVEMERKEWLLR